MDFTKASGRGHVSEKVDIPGLGDKESVLRNDVDSIPEVAQEGKHQAFCTLGSDEEVRNKKDDTVNFLGVERCLKEDGNSVVDCHVAHGKIRTRN